MTENTLLINYIIGFAALALVAVILITIPFRIKKNGKDNLKDKGGAFWAREIAIFIASILIIVLSIFIHFEIVPTICLCGCGVIASWIGVQELFTK